jgi:DNA-binding response OmpR family regulator
VQAVSGASPARVLVIEDEVDLAVTCERLLRHLGYSVVRVGSHAEGLSVIQGQPISLVITDVRLPDGNGLDLIPVARLSPEPPPVIVVTGFTTRESREAALAAGASAYLPKPFSTTDLASHVRQLLGTPPRGAR